MTRSRILCALLSLLVVLGAACNGGTTTSTPVVQTPGTVLVEGDSVTFQTLYGGGDLGNAQVNATIGATANTCPRAMFPNCVPATTNVPLRVGEGEVDTMLWALGLNDANPATNGWTNEDVVYWAGTFNKLPADSCLVLVMPAVGPGASAGHIANVDKVRNWIASYNRPNTIKIDWAPYVNDPLVMDKDGVHLRWVDQAGTDETVQALQYAAGQVSTSPTVDPYAASVRAGVYMDGLSQCGA